jgi:D-3-phosphoglycerate dehydrogenase / 2-oxoglutarate reductase
MSAFSAVLIEHGYSSVQHERAIIEAAGGKFIDCDGLPLEQTLAHCAAAEAIMLRRLQVTRALIQGFRRCKILLRYGVGVDNIDVAAATDAGIIVGHVPIYCQDEVSAHAIALLLACVRRIVPTHNKMQEGGWELHRTDPVYRLAGKTIGLVGLGTLGQAVAKKLNGWNVRLIASDPYIESETAAKLDVSIVPLETLLAESDIVSLHIPLLPETTHLINAATLSRMKHGAILVNTSRGPVVSGADLLQALDSGLLSCAALDVFEEEPLAADSALRQHPRLILTDHMAWYSEESQIELQTRAAEEVVRCCRGGLPEAIANPDVLAKLRRVSEWTPNYLARWQAKRSDEIRRKHLQKT